MNKEKIYNEASKRFKIAVSLDSDNRERAIEDVQFRDGDQWPEQAKKERQNESRLMLTFNHMEGFIDQVKGDQRQNRVSIRVRSVGGNNLEEGKVVKGPNMAGSTDYELAEIYGGLIKNIEYTSKAHIAYNTAFDHQVGHGKGYIRLITEYSDDSSFDQDIKIKRVKNSFTVYCGPHNDLDGSDMMYCFVSEFIDYDDYKDKYGDKAPIDFSLSGRGEYFETWFDGTKVRVAEYYKRVKFKKTIAKLNTHEVVSLGSTEDEIESTKAAISLDKRGLKILQIRQVDSYKVERYLISGGGVIEGPSEFPCKYIPIIPVVGKELNVEGKTYTRGVIRHAKDAQMNYNFWETSATEQVALSPKAPYLLTPEQVEGYETHWSNANKKNYPYLVYNHVEGQGRPMREPPPQVPSGSMERISSSRQNMMFTTGIHEGGLGARSNETSGRAITARQTEGDVATFEFHDNLSIAISHVGLCLIDMIPRIYDTQRVIRIINNDDTEDLVEINKSLPGGKIINDLSVGKYDVVVDTGPSFTTQRNEMSASIIDMTKSNPNLWQTHGDLIINSLDFPNSDKMAERFRKVMPKELLENEENGEEEQEQPTFEEQIAMMQAELEKARIEAEKAKAEAEIIKAQASIQKTRIEKQIMAMKLEEQENKTEY